MDVKLISMTQPFGNPVLKFPEDLIVYAARVSSPQNQHNTETGARLIKYLLEHKHFSPFEQVSMGVEIHTSRAISAQILRHRSFHFQEFSQRYAEVQTIEKYPARAQHPTNRQLSTDTLPIETVRWFADVQVDFEIRAQAYYKAALDRGVAKECARFLLPMSASTVLYMTGTVRDWIFYLKARCAPEAQQEHREIAEAVRDTCFKPNFPIVSEAVGF
jgi:thymidylate synthase (FAD)